MVAVLLMVCCSMASAQVKFYSVSPSGHNLRYRVLDDNTVAVIGTSEYTDMGYTFYGVNHVVIPDSVSYNEHYYYVVRIQSGAFGGANMKSITMGNRITDIEGLAFQGTTALTAVYFSSSTKTIGQRAFYGCSNLTTIVWGGVDSIASQAFMDCVKLTELSLDSIRSINYQSFAGCTALKSVVIGRNTQKISADAFSGCNSLKTLYYNAVDCPEGGSNSVSPFSANKLTTVYIGEEVLSLPSFLLYGCSAVQRIYSACVNPPTAGSFTFYGLNNVTKVEVPCGSIPLYKVAPYWSAFNKIVDPCPRVVTFYPNEYWKGSVIGVKSDGMAVYGYGEALLDEDITIFAIPMDGYRFVMWSDSVADNPRNLHVEGDTVVEPLFDVCQSFTDTVVLHDTTYMEVPVEVHDTTILTDTLVEYEPIHDTLYVDVHDTTYVNIHDTTYIDVVVHDTTVMTDTVLLTEYIPVHDTTYITQVDTITLTQYDTVSTIVIDTITNVVTDTVVLTETLYDTLWMHDTIFIHDTVYITQEGIGDVQALNAKVYASNGQIVVEGAGGNEVALYDVSGRVLAVRRDDGMPLRFDAPATGTYMIKVGNYHARKVVVIK